MGHNAFSVTIPLVKPLGICTFVNTKQASNEILGFDTQIAKRKIIEPSLALIHCIC